jgi:very-short-patch-repair endonuclease
MDYATDHRVAELASLQHGVVARRQLRELHIRADAVARRVAQGRLRIESDRVLRVAGSPADRASRAMAAVLDAGSGAAVSYTSAAATWRLPGFRLDPVHVTGGRGCARHDGSTLGVVHEPRRLLAHHVVELDRIPVTTPSRTLFDLAGLTDVNPKQVSRVLDTAWSRGLVSHASLTRMLGDLAARGRAGITLMRALLDERPPDHRPPGSSTEARFQEVALSVGLRGFERQVDVGGDDGWIGRVDFVDRGRRLVVEVVDALFHGSLTDQRHDRARWQQLSDEGWTVEVVDGFDIFHRTEAFRSRLASIARRSGVT